jgi:valyl-tRNA synthetase
VTNAAVYVYLQGVIDFSKELARLDKEISKLEKEIDGLGKKLENQGFLSKAPQEVVSQARQQHSEAVEKMEKFKNHREKIRELIPVKP